MIKKYIDAVLTDSTEESCALAKQANIIAFPSNKLCCIFKCPCGCEELITVNLDTGSKPCWEFNIENKMVTLIPSIQRASGCMSHFTISDGRVDMLV